MIIVDRLLIGGIRFVLDKIVAAVDRELSDADVLRQRLLEAEMRAELGEISDAELAEIQAYVVARLREIQEAQGGALSMDPETMRVAGVDISFESDDPLADEAPSDDPPR